MITNYTVSDGHEVIVGPDWWACACGQKAERPDDGLGHAERNGIYAWSTRIVRADLPPDVPFGFLHVWLREAER